MISGIPAGRKSIPASYAGAHMPADVPAAPGNSGKSFNHPVRPEVPDTTVPPGRSKLRFPLFSGYAGRSFS